MNTYVDWNDGTIHLISPEGESLCIIGQYTTDPNDVNFDVPLITEPIISKLDWEMEQTARHFTDLIQLRLDIFAQTRGYDGILSACTYVTSTISQFQVEGQYCVEMRDATWVAANTILNDVMAGTRPMPTWKEVEAELPALEWPIVPQK